MSLACRHYIYVSPRVGVRGARLSREQEKGECLGDMGPRERDLKIAGHWGENEVRHSLDRLC